MSVTRNQNKKPLVSIVIRTLNENRFIERLLVSIYKQDIVEPFEVIVVDSGSEDKTLDIIKKYPVKILYIKPRDFSFGYSLNKGIKQARGKYIVFTSAHCYPVNENWLANIIRPFEDEKIGLVYGKQRGNHLNKFSEKQIFKNMFPDKPIKRQKTPFCNNANCAIRRSIWETIPYDEKLTGLEDLDWANKILQRGYYLYYNPEAEVIHVHTEDTQNQFRRFKREAIALKKIFPETNVTFINSVYLCFSNISLDYLRAMSYERKITYIWEIPHFRLVQFLGAYRGHRNKKSFSKELKKYYYYSPSIKKNK